MKIVPVSGDLLVKLAMVAAIVGAAVWAARRAASAVPDLSGLSNSAREAAWAINPANPNNVAANAVNAGLSATVGREENLGGWLYSLTHPDPVTSWSPPPFNGGGRLNNPSAYLAPAVSVFDDPTYDALGGRTN